MGVGAAFMVLVLASTVLWLGEQGCVDRPAPVSAFIVTPCPTPILFNSCDSLTANGSWNALTGITFTSVLSLSTFYVTQGQYSLDVNITSSPANGYNQNMLQLTGFTPNVWTNISQLTMDVTVDPTVVAGASYSEFNLIASNNTTAYFSPISSNTPTLFAGSQSVTWNIAFAPQVGTMPPTSTLYELYFIYNRSTPGAGQAIGNIYVDNIRLIQNCP
jgi:hypothetical protein